MKKDPKYWQDLVSQYKRGEISMQDRYILEKEALDDPFLFDALEGYQLYGEESITNEKPKTAMVFLRRVAPIAAVLIAILSAIYLMRNETSEPISNGTTEIAANQSSNQSEVKEKIIASNQSSATDKTESSTPTTKTQKTKQPQPKKKRSKAKPATYTDAGTTANSDLDDVDGQSEGTNVYDEELAQQTATASQPDSFTAEKIKEETIEVSSDIATDVESANDEMSEKDKNQSNNKKDIDKTFYQVLPMIGKKDFDDYVRQRIKERGLQQDPPQEVTIEFSIDADGNLSEFLHIYQGCSECGPYAISILSNSGVWRTVPAGQAGRARYTFMF